MGMCVDGEIEKGVFAENDGKHRERKFPVTFPMVRGRMYVSVRYVMIESAKRISTPKTLDICLFSSLSSKILLVYLIIKSIIYL
jgi:hypothetical protein